MDYIVRPNADFIEEPGDINKCKGYCGTKTSTCTGVYNACGTNHACMTNLGCLVRW